LQRQSIEPEALKKLKKLHKTKLPKAAKESNRISQLTQKRLNRNEKATAKSQLKIGLSLYANFI
jgi:hypothetical protein